MLIRNLFRSWVSSKKSEGVEPGIEAAFLGGAETLRDELERLSLPVAVTRRMDALLGDRVTAEVSYIALAPASVAKLVEGFDPVAMEMPGGTSAGWGTSATSGGALALAKAIIADATGEPLVAERLAGRFAAEALGRMSDRGFVLTRFEVLRWVDKSTSGADDSRWREGDFSPEELPF